MYIYLYVYIYIYTYVVLYTDSKGVKLIANHLCYQMMIEGERAEVCGNFLRGRAVSEDMDGGSDVDDDLWGASGVAEPSRGSLGQRRAIPSGKPTCGFPKMGY